MAEVPLTRSPATAGLAEERTTLAWRRTALALVVNGVLLLLRHERALPQPWSLLLGVLAAATAAFALVVGVRRSRTPRGRHPSASVVALGAALTLLCGLTALTLLVRLLHP